MTRAEAAEVADEGKETDKVGAEAGVGDCRSADIMDVADGAAGTEAAAADGAGAGVWVS